MTVTRPTRLEPDRIWTLLEPLAQVVPNIITLYEDLHDYAYDHSDRPTDEQDTPVRSSKLSNPTEQIARAQSWQRSRLRKALGKASALAANAHKLESYLEQSFVHPDDEEIGPLSSYRTPTQEETKVLRRAMTERDKRRMRAEINRHESIAAMLQSEVERMG